MASLSNMADSINDSNEAYRLSVERKLSDTFNKAKSMDEIPIHPACTLVPPMSEDEFTALKDSIRENGMIDRVLLCDQDGRLVDGRHRARAALELLHEDPRPKNFIERILPKFRPVPNAEVIAIAANVCRRHLSSMQRACLAIEMLPQLEAEAKRRMAEGGKQGKQGGEKVPHPFRAPKSVELAASAMGTNSTYVRKAKKMKAEDPDVFSLAMRGGEVKKLPAQKTPAEKKRARKPRRTKAQIAFDDWVKVLVKLQALRDEAGITTEELDMIKVVMGKLHGAGE